MTRHLLLGLTALLTSACASKPPLPDNPGVSSKKSDCTLLPHGCAQDSCPSTVLPLLEGCSLSAKGLEDLDGAARELLDTPLLTKLVVVAPSLACANVIRAGFEARGAQEGRIQVAEVENRSFVSFAVQAWNEHDCGTGAVSKVPVGK